MTFLLIYSESLLRYTTLGGGAMRTLLTKAGKDTKGFCIFKRLPGNLFRVERIIYKTGFSLEEVRVTPGTHEA